MRLSSLRFATLAAVASLALCSAVSAQTYAPTPLTNIGPTDLIPDAPAAGLSVQQQFVTPTQISGAPGYNKSAPVTGFVSTFGKAQVWMLLYPAGTLANGGAVTELNPSDGQRECIRSTQTVTAFTYTPNPAAVPAQTITSPPTTISAGPAVCWTYSKANATWDPS